MSILDKLGISTPTPDALVKAQTLFFERAAALGEALESAKGKVSEVVERMRSDISPANLKDVESVSDAFYKVAEQSEGADRIRFYLAAIDKFETLVEYCEGEVQEYAASTLTDASSETLSNAATLYEEAVALREFATSAYNLYAQLGSVPSELKVTTRKVRGGNEATVLDWPRISNPSEVNVTTGKRNYTTNLPVWSVDGTELPHGTTARTVAVSHLSTKDVPLNASALLSTIEAEVGKDYRQKGGTITVNGKNLTFTEWREVK